MWRAKLLGGASCAMLWVACAAGVRDPAASGGAGGATSAEVGAGGSLATNGAGGGGGAPAACPYPAGPYGLNQGQVLDPALAWQGYAVGASSPTTIQAKDLYDCDGSKQINALLFDVAATWCEACKLESMDLPGVMTSSWSQDGVKVITLMIQDQAQAPATTATALQWRNNFHLDQVATVAADPNMLLLPHTGGGISLPTNVLVDPRTMKITGVVQGYAPGDPSVDALARHNKK